MSKPKWEYLATEPDLPPDATSQMMNSQTMTRWLNDMDAQGWEFVSYGAEHWSGGATKEWWIFRRPAGAPQ